MYLGNLILQNSRRLFVLKKINSKVYNVSLDFMQACTIIVPIPYVTVLELFLYSISKYEHDHRFYYFLKRSNMDMVKFNLTPKV